MDCEQFKDEFHEHYLDRLPEARLPALDDHAAGCPECKELMDRAAELPCREFVEFVNEFIEGELPPDRLAVFERHLEICSDCKAYLGSCRRTKEEAAAALSAEPYVPKGLPAELIQAILDARKE